MQALIWWTVPIGATVLAILVISFISRPKKPADPKDSVADYQRFSDALGTAAASPVREAPSAHSKQEADDTNTAQSKHRN